MPRALPVCRALLRRAAALAAGLVLFTSSGPAGACSCPAVPKPQLAGDAAVIFTGEANSVNRKGNQLVARFSVQVGYKGRISDEMSVSTGLGEGDCGYRFEQGERYTVFAVRTNGGLGTSLCSGTTVGSIDPATYGLIPSGANSSGNSALTFAVGALLIGAAVWALVRLRRRAT